MLYFSFYFAFLLIKNSSRVFETGSVGLVETQLFLRLRSFKEKKTISVTAAYYRTYPNT